MIVASLTLARTQQPYSNVRKIIAEWRLTDRYLVCGEALLTSGLLQLLVA